MKKSKEISKKITKFREEIKGLNAKELKLMKRKKSALLDEDEEVASKINEELETARGRLRDIKELIIPELQGQLEKAEEEEREQEKQEEIQGILKQETEILNQAQTKRQKVIDACTTILNMQNELQETSIQHKSNAMRLSRLGGRIPTELSNMGHTLWLRVPRTLVREAKQYLDVQKRVDQE